MRLGMSNQELFALTKIDPWFLEQIREIVDFEPKIVAERGMIGTAGLRPELLLEAKQLGFADERLAQLLGVPQGTIRGMA